MPLTRKEKEAWIADLKSELSEVSCAVVVNYSGLPVDKMTELRAKFKEADSDFTVTRNRLTLLALDGTGFENMKDFFVGPTALAYGDDPVAISKIIKDFAKETEKLAVIGGEMDGNILDAKAVDQLASLPSEDELRAKIISIIQTPARNLVGVSQAPAEQLARVVNAYSEKAA